MTTFCSINATGNYVFSRVDFNNPVLKRSTAATEKLDWVNREVFIDILKHVQGFI